MAVVLRVIDDVNVPCKFCNRCAELKPIYMFSTSKRSNDGYREWCKACNNEASKRSRLKYKPSGRTYEIKKKDEPVEWSLDDND